MRILKILAPGILLVFLSYDAFPADVVNTHPISTVAQNSVISTTHTELAKDWGLSEFEWNRYVVLMSGPSGHYYAKLSPPEVLGVNADTLEDLRHFADISAKFEHDKLERELRFNVAFREAATKLYSSEKLIKPFDLRPFTPIPKN